MQIFVLNSHQKRLSSSIDVIETVEPDKVSELVEGVHSLLDDLAKIFVNIVYSSSNYFTDCIISGQVSGVIGCGGLSDTYREIFQRFALKARDDIGSSPA
jgi:hypothetical protein